MKKMLFVLAAMIAISAMGQDNKFNIFSTSGDIGNPAIKGSAQFNPIDQSYKIKGAGYNIWFERDEFFYLYNSIEGDFILTANFSLNGDKGNKHRKTGWMIRGSASEKSPHISAVLHGDGLTVMQWRGSEGAAMRDPQDEAFARDSSYNIIQLERKGNTFIMRAAHTGEPLQLIGSHVMDNMEGKVLAGIFICSHDPAASEEATVWNVRIDKPVADSYDPGKQGYLGCRLETMNITDFKRKVIFEKPSRFEAPNWMPDGKQLLFNMDGSLFTIPVSGGDPQKLNTGSASNLNNDHGISFNGKLLAISNHRQGLPGGGSSVYILPLKGGEPKLLTEETPSYWHGWSPNNKEVLYVAQRNGGSVYNIYRKSIKGGKEVALTANKPGEHVDGCEYSPDGKYIYYNGSHTGKMHLWRMKPDGTGREELTSEEFNDWFPHISPDGKWILFISFPPDVNPNDHPSYKRVMLRIMPAEGGKPKTIAYLYGGQGTINVPSWSPDSRQVAFVSNSGR